MLKFWKKDKKENEDIVEKENVVQNASESVEGNIEDLEKELQIEANFNKETIDEIKENLQMEVEKVESDESIQYKEDELILSEEISEINDEKVNNNETEQYIGEDIDENKGLFSRLLSGLSKTKNNITVKIDRILGSYAKIDDDMLEEIEEILITADVGMNTTMEIVDKLRELIKERCIKDPKEVMGLLREVIEDILNEDNSKLEIESPTVIVMVGVNGVGKTTTIGKLAQRYKEEGKKVILGAGDTFRAAASEQLEIWAKRIGVDIVKHSEGADPGAVVFDAIKASKARNADLLIVDTAGRLHNKSNLMKELGKIFKIIDREYPEAKLEVLLVVDATTGQNAVSQAKTFNEVCDITGIVLTKLDGTAKGGVVLAVKSEVGVPVKLIGVGETAKDLQDFEPKSFTEALFGE